MWLCLSWFKLSVCTIVLVCLNRSGSAPQRVCSISEGFSSSRSLGLLWLTLTVVLETCVRPYTRFWSAACKIDCLSEWLL